MKSKSLRKTLAIAMSAATLLTSAVSLTAFATEDTSSVQTASESEIVYVEDHSIIDCPNRYKMNDGNFNFTIKVPKGISLSDVKIGFLAGSDGYQMYASTMDSLISSLTYQRSDDTSDYYEFITGKRGGNGAGINLYCEYNGSYYMATNNANYSTVRGCGYWLEA